jgi:hypothetical protein
MAKKERELEHVSFEEWTQFESVEVATNAYIDHNRYRVHACAEALTHLSKSYFGYHVATQGPTPHGRAVIPVIEVNLARVPRALEGEVKGG